MLFKLPLANSFPYPFVKNTPVLRAWYVCQARGGGGGGGGGGGVLWISSDRDDQMILGGFEFFDSGIFWGGKILGGLI